MPKEAKVAPDVSVRLVNADERLITEKAFDAKYPDRKHFWTPVNSPIGQGVTVAKDEDGNRVDNRMSMLCSMPKGPWAAKQKFQSDMSLQQLKANSRNEDGKGFIEAPLTLYRNPKVVKQE